MIPLQNVLQAYEGDFATVSFDFSQLLMSHDHSHFEIKQWSLGGG